MATLYYVDLLIKSKTYNSGMSSNKYANIETAEKIYKFKLENGPASLWQYYNMFPDDTMCIHVMLMAQDDDTVEMIETRIFNSYHMWEYYYDFIRPSYFFLTPACGKIDDKKGGE